MYKMSLVLLLFSSLTFAYPGMNPKDPNEWPVMPQGNLSMTFSDTQTTSYTRGGTLDTMQNHTTGTYYDLHPRSNPIPLDNELYLGSLKNKQ